MIAVWMLGTLAFADLTTEPAPVVDTESVILVTQPDGTPLGGETVRVVHRPGMVGEAEVAIGITDTRGKVRWTPVEPGLSVLRAGEQSRTLQVGRIESPKALFALLLILVVAALTALAYGLFDARKAQRRT
jgi:hypothetical protein